MVKLLAQPEFTNVAWRKSENIILLITIPILTWFQRLYLFLEPLHKPSENFISHCCWLNKMAQLHLTWLDNSLTREKNRGPCLCLCTVELGIHREIDVDDNLLYIFTTDKMFDYHCHCFKCCLDFMTYSISGTTLLPHGDNSSLVRSPRKLVQRISFQNSSSSPGNQSVTFSSGSGTHYEIWN